MHAKLAIMNFYSFLDHPVLRNVFFFQLHVLGTPGEESGNGKGRMIEAGAFDKVDAAMMVHPTPVSFADPDNKLIGIMQSVFTKL